MEPLLTAMVRIELLETAVLELAKHAELMEAVAAAVEARAADSTLAGLDPSAFKLLTRIRDMAAPKG